MAHEEEILEEEEWIGGYPPWWADWLINNKAAKTKEEATVLLLMMRAIEDGNVDEVRRYLESGIDPNTKLFSGWESLLQTALERGRSPEVANLLIDAGADINGPHVLYYAVQTGFEDVARKLLKAGLDPNRKVDGQSLIASVIWGGNLELVKLLLEHGADINGGTVVYPTNKLKVTKVTGLMIASWFGNLSMVKYLLSVGADVGRKDSLGRTALDWARLKKTKKAEKIVNLLLQAGAKPGSEADLGIVDIPDFRKAAKSPSFQESLSRLKDLTRAKPTRIELEDGAVNGGSAFAVEENKAKKIVLDHRDEMLTKGCFVFWSRDVMNKNGACVVALPTIDPYQAVAAIQTAGPNSDVTTGDVIDWLKEVEKTQPLQIEGIGIDFIEAHFLTELKDPLKLAESVAKLCPDGADTADELAAYAKHLAETRRLFLWWD